jgi:branched-chain amino acid transport system substrate-binding protein
VPSVVYGKVQFDSQARRAKGAKYARLMVRDGKFTNWDGNRPAAA